MDFLKKYQTYIFILVGLIYILVEAQGKGDFYIYLSASKDLMDGVNIYEKKYVDGYHYLYSLFFALLLYPLTFLPLYLAKFIWLSLNLFFIYRINLLLHSYFNFQLFSSKQKLRCQLLFLLFPLRFILDNFHLSQMTIFMLYLCLQSINYIHAGKEKQGALLLALGINIKLLPIVLLPYLFWRKQFKAGIFTVLFYLFLLALPAIFIGKYQNSYLLGQWWKIINPTQQEHIIDVEERSFHGLSTLLPTLLMEKVPDIYALPLKRNIASLTTQQVGHALLAIRLLLIAFSLYFLRWPPFKKVNIQQARLREISYLLALIPLIFPHQQHYAFLFRMPAGTYLIYQFYLQKNDWKKSKKIILYGLFVTVYLCFNLNLLLGVFRPYYEHYKIITYGALLCIFLLTYIRPARSAAD